MKIMKPLRDPSALALDPDEQCRIVPARDDDSSNSIDVEQAPMLMDKARKSRLRLSWVDEPDNRSEDQIDGISCDSDDDRKRQAESEIGFLSAKSLSSMSSLISDGSDKGSSSKINTVASAFIHQNSKLESKSANSKYENNSSHVSRLSAQTTRNNDDQIEAEIMEKKMSRSIWCLRTLTLTTLVTASVIVAVLTFVFTRYSELQVFQTQYDDSVTVVADAIELDITNKLNTATTFSAMYTSRYGPRNQWPNVTVPDFQKQAKGRLAIADGIAISFNPIITNQTRAGWEEHATENAHLLLVDELTVRSCDTCRVVSDGIFRDDIDGEAIDDPGHSPESRYPDHLVPIWEIYPTQKYWKEVMFNLHSEINRQHALDDMIEFKVPTITGLLRRVLHNEVEPSSILFYPVMNNFDPSPNIVGSIAIFFTWADILRSVLPDYIQGLIVVLEACVIGREYEKETVTYMVSGDNVTFLGEGDLHDSAFDEYEYVVLSNVAQEAEELGIVDFLVTYKLRMYPSDRLLKQYVTMKPLVMMLVVLLVFIMTSVIFLCYDYLVYHRQMAIMQLAKRSGRIVNSMFPSNVRERLFLTTGQVHQADNVAFQDEEANSNLRRHKRSSTIQMKKFLRSNFYCKNETNIEFPSTCIRDVIQNTPPIADLFHNTTIMFADMVTFTEWSSKHSPEDVFYLLETLFFEFDKVAERKGVFKLGTIGDCYIAITGVPDAREDHAVIMAEFADECRSKTNTVISSLEAKFGDSINKLSMRFGLHSGSVTAGVLRGSKSRFELFGDTVNTASRIESTGAPNKIQVSAQTAAYLFERGLGSWLEPRKDLVHAKGKGNLQTYWLEINDVKPIEEKKVTRRRVSVGPQLFPISLPSA